MKLELSIILKLFLNFYNSEPDYSYKKTCNIDVKKYIFFLTRNIPKGIM